MTWYAAAVHLSTEPNTNKPQIITFNGVRRISPADACSTPRSPLAVFSLSVSLHYNALLSNTIHAIYYIYIYIYRLWKSNSFTFSFCGLVGYDSNLITGARGVI